jgi:hypothetical protein
MNQQSGSKPIAFSTIGGAVGFLIGSQIGSQNGFFLRASMLALFCAFASYILYAPRQSLTAMRHAYQSTIFQATKSWKSVKRWHFRVMLVTWAWGAIATFWQSIYVAAFMLLVGMRNPNHSVRYTFFLIWLTSEVITGIILLGEVIGVRNGSSEYDYDSCADARFLRKMAIHFSPPMALWHMLRFGWFLLKFAGIFTGKFFRFTCSEAHILASSSVLLGTICGVSTHTLMMRFHHSISYRQAIVCGALIGLAYGVVGVALIRRRAAADSASDLQSS